MALRDWIIDSGQVATATLATIATPGLNNMRTVASVSVASEGKTENHAPENDEGLNLQESEAKVVKPNKRQVNCQAYEQNGVLMSTSPGHCQEWQGAYCKGCELITIP